MRRQRDFLTTEDKEYELGLIEANLTIIMIIHSLLLVFLIGRRIYNLRKGQRIGMPETDFKKKPLLP